MIPIREAVENGAWLKCVSNSVLIGQIEFRLRVLSFERINLAEVDGRERMQIPDEGVWWLMKIEAVNLYKMEIHVDELYKISLQDQNGFQFRVRWDDPQLNCWSQYSMRVGLNRFYSRQLSPKIKTPGALAFLLPDDDEAEYALVMKDGTICEA